MCGNSWGCGGIREGFSCNSFSKEEFGSCGHSTDRSLGSGSCGNIGFSCGGAECVQETNDKNVQNVTYNIVYIVNSRREAKTLRRRKRRY